MSGKIKQDMPPPKGFTPIRYTRIPAKTYFPAKYLFAGYVAVSGIAWYLYFLNLRMVDRERVEARSTLFAIMPLLVAENDRKFLRNIRKNRDYEAELMKNVEGWKVGHLYSEPLFKTLPEDSLWVRTEQDVFAHTHVNNWKSARFGFLNY